MNRSTKELLERVLDAEKLPPGTLERMSESFLFRLECGDAPLPGIDASPIVLVKPSLLARLLAGSSVGTKLGLVACLSVVTGASLWALAGPHRKAPSDSEGAVPKPGHWVMERRERADSIETIEPPAVLSSSAVTRVATVSPVAEAATVKQARSRATTGRRISHATSNIQASSVHPPAVPAAGRVSQSTGVAGRESAATEPAASAATEPQGRIHPAAPEQAPAPASTQIDSEFLLLQRAYAALHTGRPAQAFSILDEHVRRFPRGALQESREVARMLGLCATGQITDARLKAEEFLARYPKSAFRARVQRICPAKSGATASP